MNTDTEHKLVKEPDGESNKRKEAGNEKGKEIGLDESAQVELVRRSENDTQPIQC